MRRTERTDELIKVRDLDVDETIQIGKSEEIWVDDDEAHYRESVSHFILSDDRLISSLSEIGPRCGKCQKRLPRESRACSRCSLPLCRRHAKRLRENHYCAWCRRIEILKRMTKWLFQPLGSKGGEE
jgi:hypothetical protein